MKIQTKVVEYKDAFLVQWEDGIEIVDQLTGKRCRAPTMRAAKWTLSVWRRLCVEFTPKPLPVAS